MTIWWGTSEVRIRKMCAFHAKGEVARVRWGRGLCRVGVGKVMERYNFVRPEDSGLLNGVRTNPPSMETSEPRSLNKDKLYRASI